MKKIDLSLILACYNEGSTLPKSLMKILDVLNGTKYSFEIICIDDASQDKTVDHLREFSKKGNIKFYNHSENIGRGGTVKEGILMAQGEVVGFIDPDLEISAVYIPDFVRAVKEGSDVAIAYRIYSESRSSIIRWLSSKSYIYLVNQLLGLKIRDTEAGFKFFNRKKILPILKKTENEKWFFDTEIVARSRKANLKIAELTVLFLRRLDKQSTVRLIPDTIDYLKAIIEFRKKIR